MLPASVNGARQPVPAAAYLRMSTDDQQFSIANQRSAIDEYARSHSFTIVRSYTDSGKSGLVLTYRSGLKELLGDVVSGNAPFRAILVYDVSRWGRFLDSDESAYYEFICKQCNIPVHYCAESFANDNTLPSTVFKALKRTMAAEYSRELSVKVSAGLRRLSALGYRTTGTAGYGLRRMLISADGRRKQLLGDGERKSIKNDRVVLVPGPRNEVRQVREIFRLYAYENLGVTEIVRNLTNRRVPFPLRGRKWNMSNVIQILRNPKYVGMNVWGRTSRPLKSVRVYEMPKSSWTVKEAAFKPIVDRQTFERVQRIFGRRRSKNYWYSEEQLLWKLRHLAKREGRVTRDMIDRTPGPTASTYAHRFGGVVSACAKAGLDVRNTDVRRASRLRRSEKLRRDIIDRVKESLGDRVRLLHLGGAMREVLVIDGKIRIALWLGRPTRTPLGHRRWALRILPHEAGLTSIVCLRRDDFNSVERMYLVPPIDRYTSCKTEFRIKENGPLLRAGVRLRDIDELYPAVYRLLAQHSVGGVKIA